MAAASGVWMDSAIRLMDPFTGFVSRRRERAITRTVLSTTKALTKKVTQEPSAQLMLIVKAPFEWTHNTGGISFGRARESIISSTARPPTG